MHYASNAFLISPPKAIGLQPITIYNVGRVTERFTLHVSGVAATGAHCAPTFTGVPWFRLARDRVTVKAGHHKSIAVTVSHVPPGKHDVSVIAVEQSSGKGISVASAAAAQEIVGRGHAGRCATLAAPATATPTAPSHAPLILAVALVALMLAVAVATAVVARKRIRTRTSAPAGSRDP